MSPSRTSCLPSLFAAAAAAAMLAACGGGGGDTTTSSSTPTATPAPTPAPAPTPTPAPPPAPAISPDLVTTVTPPTYAAGTVERGAWNLLMGERAACGFGLVQQDTHLDAANKAHAQYLAQASAKYFGPITGDLEVSSESFFTGISPQDRAVAAGFPSTGVVNEILTARTATYQQGTSQQYPLNEAQGVRSMRDLLGTVYHLIGGLNPGRVGGAGAVSVIANQGSNVLEAYRFGASIALTDPAHPQLLGTGNIATYPCAGATAAVASWTPSSESPPAFPNAGNVQMGTPIFFRADAGTVLTVDSASITAADGSAVVFQQLDQGNDPAGLIGKNMVFFVPTNPLTAGSAYKVAVTGKLDGAAFSKNFSFTPAP